MTENVSDLQISREISMVSSFVEATRNHVASHGDLHDYFDKLSEKPFDTVGDYLLGQTINRTIWKRLIEDSHFRNFFLGRVKIEEDRYFLSNFIDGWLVWRDIYPYLFDALYRKYTKNMFTELSRAHDYNLNDIVACVASIDASSMTENLTVRALMRLSPPNKNAGQKDTLVMSTGLESFLHSMNLCLSSLILNEAEQDVLMLNQRGEKNKPLLNALDRIGETVSKLRKQFP